MELDHVLVAAPDLDAAARAIEARHGLRSVEGGRHPGWGTANRIVPLGATYLELVAVVDPATAAGSSFGRWVAAAASRSARPLGWAVRTGELDTVARRLGLTVHGGSRTTPTGAVLSWRTAGIDEAAAEPTLPFFIEWGPGTPFPGGAAVRHRRAPVAISTLLLGGDARRLAAWLGDHALPVVVREGRPAVDAVVLSTAGGETVLRAEPVAADPPP